MAIRFIYFDLGKVLLDFTHERGLSQIARVSEKAVDVVRAALVESGLSDRYESGDVTTAEFHQEFCQRANVEVSLEELTLAWGDIFEIIPQSLALAANLRSAGHQVGILSNTCEAHWDFAVSRFSSLSTFFDPVITSYSVRSMKPARGIYEAAAASVNIPPNELFFVDDRAENVEAARALGWNARLFTTQAQLAADLECLGVRFNR